MPSKFIDSENQNSKITTSKIINHHPTDDIVFALPSEEYAASADHLLVEDGFIKNQSAKVFKKGSKVGTEFNIQNPENQALREKKYLGRKSSTQWSTDISQLRKRFGFSWQKFGRRFALFTLVFGILFLIGVSGVAAVAIDMWNKTPSIDSINRTPAQSSVVYASDGKTKIYEFYGEENREIIPLKEIPRIMRLAVIALEDENFYNNTQGIPWKNMAGAAATCFQTTGDQCRGASGISQQLMKNITGDKENSPDRKLRELLLAMKLNQEKNHNQILELYLNWVPFGRNAYGVQQASKSFFGRAVNEKQNGQFVMTAPEACYLAAMIQNPGRYPTGIGRPKTEAWLTLEKRKNACLEKLRAVDLPLDDKGTIGRYIKTDQELVKLQKIKSVLVKRGEAGEARKQGKVAFIEKVVDDPFPHFREYITEEIKKFLPDKDYLYTKGLKIVTTLDPKIQRDIEGIVRNSEATIRTVGADNASSVIVDGSNGRIVAMVGSLDYNRKDIDGSVNIATSPQQPGSSIKPYVYGAAFANGFNPGSVVVDVQTSFPGYPRPPKNFSGTFSGPVTMRYALQNSLNIPAIKTLFLAPREDSRYGYLKDNSDQERMLNGFFNFAQDAGLRFPCVSGAFNQDFKNGAESCKTQKDQDTAYRGRCFLASSLGGCEVNMVSHVTGINTLLHNGNLRTATPFISIKYTNSQGKEVDLYKQKFQDIYPWKDGAIDPLVARQVANVMSDYSARDIGVWGDTYYKLKLDDNRWRVAAKTGTSNGPKDFWTMGGSTYYTVGLWVGRTDNASMNRFASSGKVAAGIWKDIMEYMHAGKQPTGFKTDGLVSIPMDSKSGYPSSGSGYSELLTPKQRDQIYYKGGTVAINKPADTSKLARIDRQDIFKNRSTVIPTTTTITPSNKLFAAGATQSVKRCYHLVAEFPNPPWQSPIKALTNANPDDIYCSIEEISGAKKDEDSEVKIASNLDQTKTGISQIWIRANGEKDVKITKTEILVDSTAVATTNTNYTAYDTSTYTGKSDSHSITVRAYYGAENKVVEKTYKPVTFVSESASKLLTPQDVVATLNCPNTSQRSSISCSFSFPQGLEYANTQIQVGTAAARDCQAPTARIVTCQNIPVPVTAGTYPIKVIIGGDYVVSKETMSVD